MLTNDPQPEYPFLGHPCVTPAMERHYRAWRSFDQGAGVWAAVETVARKLRVCERTVQYNLRRLKAVGLIEVKEQFQDGHQLTNFYLFPTPFWWVSPGQAENCTLIEIKTSVSQQNSPPPLQKEQGEISKTRNHTGQAVEGPRRGPLSTTQHLETSPPSVPAHRWGGGIQELADRYQDAQWVVDRLRRRPGQARWPDQARVIPTWGVGENRGPADREPTSSPRPGRGSPGPRLRHTLSLASEIHTVVPWTHRWPSGGAGGTATADQSDSPGSSRSSSTTT